MKTTFCVISHTHWDREWYFPFEVFRMKLVDLIDHLFEIIEKYPKYIFHLDAQTIVLEDYLAVKPYNREKLEGYIRSGNILVGPWYVQNDFYLSSGEATVRNLLIGEEIADSFGGGDYVGYTPDQFGNPGQLPQILKGFDIGTHIFGRGVAYYQEEGEPEQERHADFRWESPDGSRVYSVLMPYWYNNAQRITPDIDKAIERLDRAETDMALWTKSPYLLMMNGVDHLEAQDDLLPILEKINERMKDRRIEQTTMTDFLTKSEPYCSDLVRKGEMRESTFDNILAGTFSTRVDIKRSNYAMQNEIERRIEPLYAMLETAGFKGSYPWDTVRYLWKMLIPNHAHDSICCCSNINVMRHMVDRYRSMSEISKELILRGMRFWNHHTDRSGMNKGEYLLTVVNPGQTAHGGVTELRLDILVGDGSPSTPHDDKKEEQEVIPPAEFILVDPDGNEVPYEVISYKRAVRGNYSALNLPGGVQVDRYEIMVKTDLDGFSYTNYRIVVGKKPQKADAMSGLENEFIKVSVSEEGKVSLTDKKTGRVFIDLLELKDIGDRGCDSYRFRSLEGDSAISATFGGKEVACANSLRYSENLWFDIDIPAETVNEAYRSTETVAHRIGVTLTVNAGDPFLRIKTTFVNSSKHHKLFMAIRTGVAGDITCATSAYEVVRRNRTDEFYKHNNGTQPNSGLLYQADKDGGLAIYTGGTYEYEQTGDGEVALTLLRSTEYISASNCDAETWGVPENLMLGMEIEHEFAILPFTDEAVLPAQEGLAACKLLSICEAYDIHTFVGGRPAVQDTETPELYYDHDNYADISLPMKGTLLSVSPEVCVTAFKRAEKSDDLILRAYNPTGTDRTHNIKTDKKLTATDLAERRETALSDSVAPYKIATFRLQ